MDQAQGQRLLACLAAATGEDAAAIKAVEAQLAHEATQPGYGPALAHIMLAAGEVPHAARQLAAVLLKQYVRAHWVDGERGFQPPESSEADKAAIRAALPNGLRDPDSKIRTAAGMAIAAVAAWDWPQAWPGLLEFIVGSIKQHSDPNLVAGCLRCLSVMAADLDNEQAPQLLQALSPELAALAASPATPQPLAATCFAIMAELASGLANLSGTYQRQVRNMLVPLMQPWMPLLCGMLTSDVTARPGWGPKLAALKLAQPLVAYFSKPLEASMPQLMGAAWQLLLAAQPLHQALLVEGADDPHADEALVEGEDEPVTLEGLLAQLFELLLSFVGPPRFRAQLEGALREMVHVAIAYLQITQDQAEAWSESANQFVADEEEDFISCRASAELLLTELADEFDATALRVLLEGVAARWAEADAAAAAGAACWWQLREAGLAAIGAACDQLVQAVLSSSLPAQQVQQLLDRMIQQDLQLLLQQPPQQQQQGLGNAGPQFVMARAVWVGAKLQEAATPQQRELLLRAAAHAATTPGAGAPLRVSAFRALAVLVPAAPAAQLQPLLPGLLPALLQQLAAADEEAVHLVLELLAAVVEAAAASATAGGGGLSAEQAVAVAQPVLQVWLAHTADPLIAPDAQSVIAALAAHPGCLPSLAAAAAPTLASILERGAAARAAKRQGQQPAAAGARDEAPMLLEASLDLLTALVVPRQEAVAVELSRGVLGPVLHLLQATDDTSELGSAVALLLQLLRVCPPQQLLASMGQDEAAALARLLAASRELLRPGQLDGGVRLAGPLLAQLLKAFPGQLAAPAPAALQQRQPQHGCPSVAPPSSATGASCVGLLLCDVVAQLAGGQCSPATIAGLLQPVVRLALLDVQQLVDLLAGIAVTPPGGAATSSLAVVVPLLLEHAPDMQGSLLTKQCAAALLQLLQLRHHPGLAGLLVAGRPLEAAAGSGRVTRSRARQQGGLQYSQVPAPAKVLQVLGQLLAADAEGGKQPWDEAAEEWAEEEEEYESDDEGGAGTGGAAHRRGDDSPLAGMGLSGSALKAAGLQGLVAPGGEEALLDVMERSAAPTPAPEDPADADDPLARVGMRSLLRQGLGALAAADPGFLSAAAAQLGPGPELQQLQQLLSSDAGSDGGGGAANGR